jgi:purine-binding chemotaxis protein CheW
LTCIIVIEVEYGLMGMIVDSVSSVIDLTAAQIEDCPVIGAAKKINFVLGIGKSENQTIILVNIVEALSKEEIMTEEIEQQIKAS